MSTIDYVPRGTFVDDVQPPPVPVSAQNLNAMDDGIEAAANGVDRLTARVTLVTATGVTAIPADRRDDLVIVDTTLGIVTIQLPSAIAGRISKRVTVKVLAAPGGFVTTVAAAGADTIDGTATAIPIQGSTITYQITAAGIWRIVADAGVASGGGITSYVSLAKWGTE